MDETGNLVIVKSLIFCGIILNWNSKMYGQRMKHFQNSKYLDNMIAMKVFFLIS